MAAKKIDTEFKHGLSSIKPCMFYNAKKQRKKVLKTILDPNFYNLL